MKKKRTYNVRRIKRDFSYSVQEISGIFGIHKNTIRQWIRGGLVLNDKNKPYLIHGSTLIDFLRRRQNSRKQTCQPNQLYCFKCRCPRPVWGNLADLTIKNEKLANLSALCAVCESPMNRVISRRNALNLRTIFNIQTKGEEQLMGCELPSVNCNLEKETIR
jgi:helix-turn-helix protein